MFEMQPSEKSGRSFNRSKLGPDSDLEMLLDSLPVPMVVHEMGAGARVRFVNQSYTNAFGYTLSDMPDLDSWAELVLPDPQQRQETVARWLAEITERQATGVVAPPSEYLIRDKTGQLCTVLVGFARMDDLVIVTFQDMTATRAAEAALGTRWREHEKAAFALTENMPAGAYAMVLRPGAELAKFAFVSKQFLRMLNLTREEAVDDPMTVFSRVHPEDQAEWVKANAEAFARREPFSGETRIIVNGQTRWVRAESVPREREDGSVIWEGVLFDVDNLKQTECKLHNVLEAARAYTWRRDLRTHRSEFDARWAALAGLPPGIRDMPSDEWLRSVHPEDTARVQSVLNALESGAVDQSVLTYRRRMRQGQWLWVQVHAGVSEHDADGKPAVLSGVSFDVTGQMIDRANAEEQLAQLREDLQRAQQRETISQVAGGVAHDIKNLFAVVAGTAEMLERDVDGQPALRDGVGRIMRSVDMARDLISSLGEMIRPSLPRAPHDLAKLTRDAVDLVGQRRIARHTIRIDLADDCPKVWAHPTEVTQVLVNLVLNACDSGLPDKAATVRLTVLPSGTAPPSRQPDVGQISPDNGPLALLSVSDTGAGISEAVRARMLKPSFLTSGETGIGMGLRIVSSILQANGAALWMDSTPGHGTTITLAWPTAVRSSASVALQADSEAPLRQAATAGLLDGINVLVVDDMLDLAEVMAETLEAAGAVAVAVSDPKEAARALSEAPDVWSAVVTDLHMPDMDGRALARHAASLSPPAPVVLVTARSDMLRAGSATDDFAAILSKPVSAVELSHAVREVTR